MDGKELIPPGLVYLADNITSKHNILGAPKETKAGWAKGLGLPREMETIFFAGCGYQYAAGLDFLVSLARRADKSVIGADRLVGIAGFQKKLGISPAGILSKVAAKGGNPGVQPLRDAVKVLGSLGVKFGYLGVDEPCCGGLLHYIGLHREFAKNAQEMYRQLKSNGVKRIISIVPSCTHTIRNLIPDCVV